MTRLAAAAAKSQREVFAASISLAVRTLSIRLVFPAPLELLGGIGEQRGGAKM